MKLSRLMKEAINGRYDFSPAEVFQLKLELIEWSYAMKRRTVLEQNQISDSDRNSLLFWIEVARVKEINELETRRAVGAA